VGSAVATAGPGRGPTWTRTWFLPLIGWGGLVLLWALASSSFAPSLPSPSKTWEASKPDLPHPFEKRGELDYACRERLIGFLDEAARPAAPAVVPERAATPRAAEPAAPLSPPVLVPAARKS